MKKIRVAVKALFWAAFHMAEAETEFMLKQNLCPHCGGNLRMRSPYTGAQ